MPTVSQSLGSTYLMQCKLMMGYSYCWQKFEWWIVFFDFHCNVGLKVYIITVTTYMSVGFEQAHSIFNGKITSKQISAIENNLTRWWLLRGWAFKKSHYFLLLLINCWHILSYEWYDPILIKTVFVQRFLLLIFKSFFSLLEGLIKK